MNKKLYEVGVSLDCLYEIEAEDENEAKDKAWEYFEEYVEEREPNFEIREI